MLSQKLISSLAMLIVTAYSLALFGCGTSSQSITTAAMSSLGTVAATAHATISTDPTIDITLTGSGDVISLVADSIDTTTKVVTYIGTDDMGHPSNPADVELGLEPVVTNFSFTFHTGGNTTYVMAVNTDTNEAYTIHYDVDGNETTAIVRTLNGTELATATATGNWELQYPATQGVNMTGLLTIIALQPAVVCTPSYSTARSDCQAQCDGSVIQIKTFKYSCDPTTGAVTVECTCESSS